MVVCAKKVKMLIGRIHFNVHFKENAIIFVQIERMLKMHSKYNGKINKILVRKHWVHNYPINF